MATDAAGGRADLLPVVRSLDLRMVAPGATMQVFKRVATAPDGSPVGYPVTVIAGAAPGPVATLVAGIHGDEYEGPQALFDLLATTTPDGLAGTLVVVPVAHLAAFASGTRASPIDGVNLARIFPGDPDGTITERLAFDLFDSVIRPADLVIDLHSGGVRYAFLQVAGWYAEGPGVTADAAAASLAAAQAMGLPHLWSLPHRPGVLSYEAARAGIAATGAEAGGRGGCTPEDSRAYRDGVRRVLAAHGMVQGSPEATAPATHYLEGDFVAAPIGGLVEPLVPLGSQVTAGTALLRIRPIDGGPAATVHAQSDGIVLAERHLRMIQPGEGAVCAVRRTAFA